MGLKWIGNYVQEGKEGRPHVKENSHLIIDGDSMVYMVPETRLATREDGMRGLIKREFQMWKELAGDIVVFFDGSSGECKIATSLKRRSKRRGNFSVPLLKVTMKSVLKELSIPVKQCWGEADNVMLSYAQAKSPEYNEIYVLTRDSDFFCANVSILSRTKLDSELSQVVTYEREGILNALNLEPRHLPLYALLVESDYLEYENLEWVYRKMFPKIDKETYTYMCKKSYCHSFLNVIAVYIKHCERKLGEAFQVTSEAGAAVALRQIMGTDDPPKHVFKKIWEALVELLPIQRVPDDIGLPAEFTEEFLKGNLDCDFADMYLGMEWWADPLCELEDTHPPLARLPFFLQIRKYLYGLLAFPSSKPFKEYGVMGVTEAARYGLLSPATLPEQLTVKGVKYSLQTIWSRSLAPCEENRIDAVCSMLLGRILYPRPDLRNADHVVSLFVTCLYHACPEGGLLNFEIEAAINALTNHDETILDDLVKGDKERQLCSLATHVLVHIGYAVDVFRVADRVECVRTGAWPTFCFSSFYSAYQRFLPPTDRSKTNFTEASRTFSPTHAGIFSLSSSWCSVDLTSLTGSGTAPGYYNLP
eukprot:TRINITY_DN14693_c0_g1_i1.p1 TRINITY_DN14693_c0_g1~~TRINITY_DN14693_c0_g1_i1.p1  ORF type:complete len:607 (+),score=95.17 TRINITY_DN14693_c0_g1_i1:52-1821(+)